MNTNKNNLDNKNINNYQKRGFIKNLPFGVKATFIKYWFYGALYFFCFMGLGLVLKNENLVLVTGLIGGVLFDIALYNIFLLFADTREEASKWWIYKSRHFYSFFINIIVITGIVFAFYYIVVPIRTAIDTSTGGKTWLFAEPLSSAIILVTLDTGVCWIKNLLIIAIKKIFKLGDNNPKRKIDYIKLLDVSPVSATLELDNDSNYYSNNPYNVFLNNEIIFKKLTNNVFTIYDLKPDTQYKVTINKQNFVFTTSKIFKFYKVYEGNDIQKIIDNADQYSLIVVNKGTYKINRINLKSNITIYFRKGVTLSLDNKDSNLSIKDEKYISYFSKETKIIKPIINIENVRDVKIISEGVIDGEGLLNLYKGINTLPPNLIFINQSSNISIVGCGLKNSPGSSINVFFSNNINLLNLDITNSNDNDGVNLICSSSVNINGSHIINGKDAIAIKASSPIFDEENHSGAKDIVVRNTLIEKSFSAISLGDECCSGIYSINISRCSFNRTNYGFVARGNVNNGPTGSIKDINVKSITMDKVLVPLVVNMHHGLDVNKEIKTSYDVKKVPYFATFSFKNIVANDYSLSAGFFYGLNEKFIGEINISNSSFTASKDIEGTYSSNKMIDISKCNKAGFIAKNIRTFELNNVKIINQNGKKIEHNNISELIDR